MKTLLTVLIAFAAVFPSAGFAADSDLSEAQLADLNVWLTSKDTAEYLPAENRLRTLLKTKGKAGEELAGRLLRIARAGEPTGRDIGNLLWSRAIATAEEDKIAPHLDGPYLREFARMSVPDDAGKLHFRNYHPVIAYLKLHPEDHEIYWRLRLAATRDAKVSNYPAENDARAGDNGDRRNEKAIREFVRVHYPQAERHYGLRDAWAILLHLGVLKPGMTVGEACVILGKPSEKEEKFVRWYHKTPRHVNPSLGAEIDGETIVRFHVGNR